VADLQELVVQIAGEKGVVAKISAFRTKGTTENIESFKSLDTDMGISTMLTNLEHAKTELEKRCELMKKA
jgi:hypothetical protein